MRNKVLKNLICTRQVKCKGKWQGILKSLSNWMVEQKLFRAVKDGKFWRDIWKTHRTKNENMESENKCKMSWITHSLLPFVRQNYARWDELWPCVTELLDWFFFFFCTLVSKSMLYYPFCQTNKRWHNNNWIIYLYNLSLSLS